MKKKIAIFANGWNAENLSHIMEGIYDGFDPETADLFVFLAHVVYTQNEANRVCEYSIFSLPDLSTFDGAVVVGYGMNYSSETVKVAKRCQEAGLPTIVLGYKFDDIPYICVENQSGMTDLVEHMIEAHDAKDILFIAGDKENEDSNERLAAIRTVAAKHGINFGANNIFYSNWETNAAADYVRDLAKAGKKMPDTILCANDLLANMVTLAVDECGYNVPKDVKVTGFDCLYESRIFYPSITTVNQDFYGVGKTASKLLKGGINGKKIPIKTVLPCKFVAGESCGCTKNAKANKIRREFTRNIPIRGIRNDSQNGRVTVLMNTFLSTDKYVELAENVGKVFLAGNGCEGDTFHILMNPRFSEAATDDIFKIDVPFPKSMEIIVSKEHGVTTTNRTVKTKNLIPSYKGSGANFIYIFMPTILNDSVCGYIVMKGDYSYINEMLYNTFHSRLNSALDIYRKNIRLNMLNDKLQEIMQKDSLTAVNNRIAYDAQVVKLEEQFAAGERPEMAIAMFDVNNLKTINDALGHEAGDAYIKNCCRLICETFKHSPVYRIGGDEFVVFVQNSDYEPRFELIDNMRQEMKLLSLAKISPLNKVSIASGITEFDEDMDTCLMDVFKRADTLMYENKSIMKNGNVR